jgi:hypothetical protein
MLKSVIKFIVVQKKERLVKNMIITTLNDDNLYVDTIVEDVSSQTTHGDMLFRRHLQRMIEIKNKITLTKDDMTKFTRDTQSITEQNKINCAIFISLQMSTISWT